MDQIKIGGFIAHTRKSKNLTQAALAEQLGITDRAVSKWECGKGLPDASLMLDLCEILGITVNELLCGEKISMENKNEKNEKLLFEMAKEIEQKDKRLWSSMWVLMIVSCISMMAGIFITAFYVPEGILQTVILLGICVLFLIPCSFALKLEVSVGAYKCKKCGREIVPTYSEACWAAHRGTTRYLKCPDCKKRTWCKKILKKRDENIK